MLFDTVFHELSLILLFAVAVGFIGNLMHQPLIVSFIAAGVLAGPSAFGLAQSIEHLDLFAEFGISLLLFVVGLKLDLHLIRSMGAVALTTGIGQVVFTAVFGFLICLWLGMDSVASVYVAVALTFSSTIIVVKLLSDKREIDSLHGRVALGFLIVQDVVVVIAMIALSAIGVGGEDAGWQTIAFAVLKGVLLIAAVAAFIRWFAQPLMHRLAAHGELMLLVSVAFAVSLATLSEQLGFSKEIGAFLAGVSLASTQYRDVIGARLGSLRDFMLVFFFMGLGAHMDLGGIGEQVPAALLLSAFVLIGNPLIVMVIMGLMGYRKRTGFMAGLTVAQISEFSLIFVALGLGLGHLDADAVALTTLVGLITIASSTYMILYSQTLYRWLERFLGPFERKVPHREQREDAEVTPDGHEVVLFGLGRYGNLIARGLMQSGLRVLGVDFDPEVVRRWRELGHDAVYGDANDPEFVAHLPLARVSWVVCAMPQVGGALSQTDTGPVLARTLQANRYAGRLALTAHRPGDVPTLRAAGADVVLLPFNDAARHAVEAILGADEPTSRLPGQAAAAEAR